jgi:lipopolysaccharide transport system permease protein
MTVPEHATRCTLVDTPHGVSMTQTALPVTVLRPPRGWVPLNLHELWEYRELLYFLAWRDIKVRYKQTFFGAAWAIIQPFLTMVVFSIFFGALAGIPSNGIPYPIFAYTALVAWTYFANALTQASNSLVAHEHLITKVYFPRLILPVASVLAGLLDFAIAFLVLVAMMLFYGIVPTVAIWALPLFVLLATATALGLGLWLAALNVQYRDVRYIVPFLVQFWLFATPIAYPSSLVPETWRAIYGLNPMAGVVEGFRWALLGQALAPGPLLAISTVTVVVLLISGLYFFQRMDQTFADVI